MTTPTLYRCVTPHWQGNDFVAAGAVLPEGHAKLILEFFEPVDWDDTEAGPPPDAGGIPEEDALRAEAKELGIKVDKRWGADRLRDEIDAAKKS